MSIIWTEQQIAFEDVLGAVARGYCTTENQDKVLDPVLCVAIANEIKKLLESEVYHF